MARKKRWIQSAIKRPGALRAKAKRSGQSVSGYCKGRSGGNSRTAKQCRLAKTLGKMRKR